MQRNLFRQKINCSDKVIITNGANNMFNKCYNFIYLIMYSGLTVKIQGPIVFSKKCNWKNHKINVL